MSTNETKSNYSFHNSCLMSKSIYNIEEMDWYSPGRPIIGNHCDYDSERYKVLKKIAKENVRKPIGILTFLGKAQDIFGDGYKTYEYEIVEVFQSEIEYDFIKHEGVFQK